MLVTLHAQRRTASRAPTRCPRGVAARVVAAAGLEGARESLESAPGGRDCGTLRVRCGHGEDRSAPSRNTLAAGDYTRGEGLSWRPAIETGVEES